MTDWPTTVIVASCPTSIQRENVLKTRLGATGLAFSIIPALAFAQTNPAPSTTPAPLTSTTMPAKSSDAGLRTAATATLAVKFVSVKPADIMLSRLIGTNVYNNQNESLGEIEDLVIENGKTVTGLIVSVGGFLGIGESYVVLDPSTVILSKKDSTWEAHVDTSKDNLKNAPKFNYSKKKG